LPVEGLRLTDIVANAKEGLRAFNTSGLELHNVRINAESGPAFLIRDAVNLDIDGAQTRAPRSDAPVVRLDKVKNATLRNSIAWPGTGVFLSLAPDAKVISIANDFSGAGTPSKTEALDYWKSINTPDKPRAPAR
jgi:hypothetical protein